jgi:hypothetical protein
MRSWVPNLARPDQNNASRPTGFPCSSVAETQSPGSFTQEWFGTTLRGALNVPLESQHGCGSDGDAPVDGELLQQSATQEGHREEGIEHWRGSLDGGGVPTADGLSAAG